MNLKELYEFLIVKYAKVAKDQIVVFTGVLKKSAELKYEDMNYIEELAFETRKLAAFPILDLSSESLRLRSLEELQNPNLLIPATYYTKWIDLVDIIIDVSFPITKQISSEMYIDSKEVDQIDNSLGMIYRNMMISGKKILIPNLPKKSLAQHHKLDYDSLVDFYISTFASIPSKMTSLSEIILKTITDNEEVTLSSESDALLNLTINDNLNEFINQDLLNFYTVLPYGYVKLGVTKMSISGEFIADRVYYKSHYWKDVTIMFSNGSVTFLKLNDDTNFSEYVRNAMLNSKDNVELYIGVNNGVEDFCNFSYYDRCIDKNFSLVFFDEHGNSIQFSSTAVSLLKSNQKKIL